MTRAEYKADLLAVMDQHPMMTVSELAAHVCRSPGWVAELLMEAERERKAGQRPVDELPRVGEARPQEDDSDAARYVLEADADTWRKG